MTSGDEVLITVPEIQPADCKHYAVSWFKLAHPCPHTPYTDVVVQA